MLSKTAASRMRGIPVTLALVALVWGVAGHAQAPSRPSGQAAPRTSAGAPPKAASRAAKSPSQFPTITSSREQQLARMSRALREKSDSASYVALSAFATQNAKNVFGPRAALALGYHDLTRHNLGSALGWLRKAADEKLLREYVLYWHAQTSLAMGQREEALEQLQSLLRDFPETVQQEMTVTALAQTALALDRPEAAATVLENYPGTAFKPALLLLRAQAREKVAEAGGGKPLAAATDYLDLYYRFPLNPEAAEAEKRIPAMQNALGEAFPGTPTQVQMARAETLFLARRWRDARLEFINLLAKLSGSDRERARLRIAQCGMRSGGSPELLLNISFTDPELDAERIYSLSQARRSQQLESEMLEHVEDLVKRFPQSLWAEEALFAAGNYFWVNLDRDRAASYYRRAAEAFPDGKNTSVAAWRVAWAAYLGRSPEATGLLESYVQRFPTSSYVPNALYWLGRSYERQGNAAHARSFYVAGSSRFPLTYFGSKSAERLRPQLGGIGDGPLNPAEFISAIPAPVPLMPIDLPLSANAREREQRAIALTSIAFDASAELEYRAAYAVSHSPALLLSAARAAAAGGHYPAGIVAMRQVFPQLEARRIPEIPLEAWQIAFPLPFGESLRSAAARQKLDPMLMAGLIRQESAFDPKALSRAGAVGLMQIMPATGQRLSRQLGLRYSRSRLTDPGYNLRLGSRYLANLIGSYGTPEAALAAYNAGESRVAQWTAGQNYLEVAEFVESIPFTETREYVQTVIRNADVYRQVYRPARARQSVSRLDGNDQAGRQAAPAATVQGTVQAEARP